MATNAISTENFIAGLKEILEFAPDLFIDIPLLYDKLGKIIAPQIEKKVCFIILSVNIVAIQRVFLNLGIFKSYMLTTFYSYSRPYVLN